MHMRIFITGASGHIGSALVPELLGAGHQVLGLARSDASADKLTVAGAEVVRGSLDDLDVLAEAARESGGVIHLAFKHDLVYAGDMDGAAVADSKAIKAMGTALEGSNKPFVGIGGTLMLAMMGIKDRPGTEADFAPEGIPVASRENDVIAFADKDVRASVVRFAPVVHSELDREGFVPALIGFAKQKGSAAFVGDGSNRWPAVNTHDGATLLRLAVESAPAGTRLHGVAESGIAFKEIAETIGKNLGLPVTSVTPGEAPAYLNFLALFAAADNPASNDLTRQRFGWEPKGVGLLEDLNEGHYFA
jgi:nucleoside-diphosphate-sugar epimerase